MTQAVAGVRTPQYLTCRGAHQCIGPPNNSYTFTSHTMHYFRQHNWLCGWCHRRASL